MPATRNTPDLLYWPMDGYPHSSGGLLWIDPKVKEETQKAKADGKALAPSPLIDKTYAHRDVAQKGSSSHAQHTGHRPRHQRS